MKKYKNILLIIVIMLLALTDSIYSLDADNVLPGEKGVQLGALKYFIDENDRLNLACEYRHDEAGIDICVTKKTDAGWTAPYCVDFTGANSMVLQDTTRLSTGRPVMLIIADTTDYARFFNLEGAKTDQEVRDFLESMPQDRLLDISQENKKLYLAIQVNSMWSRPVCINGTSGADSAVIAAGSDNKALIVFSKDMDKKYSTVNDKEIYICAYNGMNWTLPVRITENQVHERDIQVESSGESFVITWTVTEDTGETQASYKRIFSAIADKDCNLYAMPGEIYIGEYKCYSKPVIGIHNEKPVVMWQTRETDVETGETKTVIAESIYDPVWTEPDLIGVECAQLSDAQTFSIDDTMILVYREGYYIMAVSKTAGKWSPGMLVKNLYSTDIKLTETAGIVDSNSFLNIAMTGCFPPESESQEIQTGEPSPDKSAGIYHTSISVLPDLAVTDINIYPGTLQVDGPARCVYEVANNGLLPAGLYSVTFSADKKDILTQEIDAGLMPGAKAVYETAFIMDKPAMQGEISIETDFNEMYKENNITEIPLKVLPDYKVRSVSIDTDNKIIARVVEQKKIAASDVPVDFYLNTGVEYKKLGTAFYNPSSDNDVILEYTGLSDLTGAYQVTAEVNHDRRIKEDDYSNNLCSYIYKPLPDFKISRFYCKDQEICLDVENAGECSCSKVDVLITDDPDVFAFKKDNSNALINEYRDITFSGNSAFLNIASDKLADLPGKKLYAILNPYNKHEEKNRNNNTGSILVPSREVAQYSAKASLFLGTVYRNSSDLMVTIANMTNLPSITPAIEIYKDDFLIARKVIPVIKSYGWKVIPFKDLAQALYKIRLVFDGPDNTTKTVETSFNK